MMRWRRGRFRIALVAVLVIVASVLAAPASAVLEHPRQRYPRDARAGLFVHWGTPASHTVTVSLAAGANTIRFFDDGANAPDLDKITLN